MRSQCTLSCWSPGRCNIILKSKKSQKKKLMELSDEKNSVCWPPWVTRTWNVKWWWLTIASQGVWNINSGLHSSRVICAQFSTKESRVLLSNHQCWHCSGTILTQTVHAYICCNSQRTKLTLASVVLLTLKVVSEACLTLSWHDCFAMYLRDGTFYAYRSALLTTTTYSSKEKTCNCVLLLQALHTQDDSRKTLS